MYFNLMRIQTFAFAILCLLSCAIAVSFEDHRIYRFNVKTLRELAFLKKHATEHNLDVWTEHPHIGFVDVY